MMTLDPLYPMALMTGLLGSGHCLGMCGGLISALALSHSRHRKPLLFHGLYHGGRVLTYTLVGAMVGWLGSVLAYANRFHSLMRLALVGSDLLVIVVGLGTVVIASRCNLLRFDLPGPVRLISRAANSLTRAVPQLPGGEQLPASTYTALPLGLLMGFLPCGFSYAMAITAAQSASLTKGALTMLCFGVGTTPALLLFGCTIHWLSQRVRGWMIRGAGLLVAVIGAYHLRQHIALLGWDLAGPLNFLCH
jgi:hypothetical protein